MRAAALVLCSCLTCGVLIAQEPPHIFVGATIIPIEGDEIESGALLVRNGKIQAVGPVREVASPPGAVRHDVSGKTIMPGLICTHSHIGGGGGERTGQSRSSLPCAFTIRSTCGILDSDASQRGD